MRNLFRGHYTHNIDAKGRLILPQKFREILGDDFVITKGLEECLYIYPMTYWTEVEDKMFYLPITDKDNRDFIRYLIGNAIEGDFDGNSRTLIPQNLREYAGISKEVVSKGMLKFIEIWSKEKFDEYENKSKITDQMLNKMSEAGI